MHKENPSTAPDLLFVYGTLRRSFDNEWAVFLRLHSEFVGEGEMPARLFDLGEYTGAVYLPEAKTTVAGEIFRLKDAGEVLAALDGYEGIGEGFPEPQEFVRRVCQVQSDGKVLDCFVYLYNR